MLDSEAGYARATAVCSELIMWINENIENRMTLQSISQRSGYSESYIHHLFKKVTGVTPCCYIRKQKLKKAACDLIEGNERIITIAVKYSFNCQSSFTRAFKQEYLVTPGYYRRMQRQD